MIHPRYLIEARNAGEIRYSVVSDYSEDLNKVLAKFGLTQKPDRLFEHNRVVAVEILVALLEKDMAYEVTAMSTNEAERLAEGFMAGFDQTGNRYYSNLRRANDDRWNSFTESTFDAGIIIAIPGNHYACIWFEDED